MTHRPESVSLSSIADTPASRTALGRYWLALVLLLVVPLAVSLYLESSAFPDRIWHEPVGHALVESFCALMSLVVFYTLHQEYLSSNSRRLARMCYGFLAMGVMDFFHAFSDSGSHAFVWFHSASALFGAGAMFAALALWPTAESERREPASRSWTGAALVLAALLTFAAGSYLLQGRLPAMRIEGTFTPFAHGVNALAGIMFLAVGLAFLAEFRAKREIILFVFAAGMFLFAEIQGLFYTSRLWNTSWWAWHGMKTAIFIAILLGVAYELGQVFLSLAASRRELLAALNAVERRNRELCAQASILEDISRSLDVPSVLDSIVRAIKDVMGLASCCIVVANEDGKPLHVIASGSRDFMFPGDSQCPSVRPAASGAAGEAPALVAAAGCDRCPAGHEWPDTPRYQCCMPLIAKGRTLGQLCVLTHDSGALREEDVTRLATFANQTAIALENAQLHQELVRRHSELSTLHSVLLSATSSLDLATVLARMAEHMAHALSVPRVLVYMLDGGDDGCGSTLLRTSAEFDERVPAAMLGSRCALAEHPVLHDAMRRQSTMGAALWSGELRSIEAITKAGSAILDGECGGRAAHGILYLPMLGDGMPLGFVVLPLPIDPERIRFTEGEVRLALAIAQQAAGAVRHAQLFQQVRQAGQFTQAMSQVMMAMCSARDVDSVLDLVSRESARLLKVDAALVWLLDRDKQRLTGRVTFAHAQQPPLLLSQSVERAPAAVREAMERGVPTALTDIPTSQQSLVGLGEGLGEGLEARFRARSLLVVPLLSGNAPLGVMILIDQNNPRPFSVTVIDQAQIFARQVSIALGTAALIEQLKAAYQRLEAAQASLIQSEKLATVGQMAMGLAHEIRNPIAAIGNCLGLLKGSSLSEEELSEVADITEKEIEHLNRIVANTLALGRPQARCWGMVDLAAVVRETLLGIRAQDRAGVELHCEIDSDLPAVTGDASQLQQVVWNLIMNALQALNADGNGDGVARDSGTVVIRLARESESVVLSVIDSGPGIPAALRERVLEPFFSQRPGGTGLGLSIVQRILSEHGGEISIESEEGTGTAVLVRLPAVAQGTGQTKAAEAAA